jgi:proliferating cell nuclear antigen PCNA
MDNIDLIEGSLDSIQKIKVKDLKKRIKEEKLFNFEPKIKKKELIKKLIEHRKEYEDSDTDEEMEVKEKIIEITENIEQMDIEVEYDDPDKDKNYVLFKNNILYEVCSILKDLVEECRIVFNNEGFEIKMIDKSLICLLDIMIKNCYERSNILDNNKVVVVNISEMIKILNCKDDDQQIKVIFEEDNMLIHFCRYIKNCDKFKLNLLNENLIDEIQDFQMKFDQSFVINSKEFSKICRKLKNFDDKIRISYELLNKNNVKFESKNELIELNSNFENNQLISINITEDLDVLLLLKYIKIFCKSDKFSKNLIVKLIDKNHPIEMTYEIDSKSYIKFVISPQNCEDDY